MRCLRWKPKIKIYTVNQLNALAKTYYYQWMILNKKIKIANDNLFHSEHMIKSMEIRYQYNMDKLSYVLQGKITIWHFAKHDCDD